MSAQYFVKVNKYEWYYSSFVRDKVRVAQSYQNFKLNNSTRSNNNLTRNINVSWWGIIMCNSMSLEN